MSGGNYPDGGTYPKWGTYHEWGYLPCLGVPTMSGSTYPDGVTTLVGGTYPDGGVPIQDGGTYSGWGKEVPTLTGIPTPVGVHTYKRYHPPSRSLAGR